MSDKITTRLNKDQFARFCGLKLLKIAKESALAAVEIKENHLNGIGITQGGLIFTLADYTFAAAANAAGPIAVSIEAKIIYKKPSFLGDILTASAKKITANSKTATYEILVENQKKELIASFTGIAFLKKE